MIAFRITTSGNLELSLRSAGMRVRGAVRRSLARAGVQVLTRAKEKLSGPVLKTRTGRLRRSINTQFVESPTRLAVQVGTNVEYAAVHEYGFDGQQTVKAHLRTMSQAFGRQIAARKVAVRAFQRHVHLPERSFLRSSLAELAPQIRAELAHDVQAALEGGA